MNKNLTLDTQLFILHTVLLELNNLEHTIRDCMAGGVYPREQINTWNALAYEYNRLLKFYKHRASPYTTWSEYYLGVIVVDAA